MYEQKTFGTKQHATSGKTKTIVPFDQKLSSQPQTQPQTNLPTTVNSPFFQATQFFPTPNTGAYSQPSMQP
jgi:hypothetical protein